jgi:hypothetical protein
MARLGRGRLLSVGRYALRGVERPQELSRPIRSGL